MTKLSKFMREAPADCRPTVFDPNKAYLESLLQVAKKKGKKVEELDEFEKDWAMKRIGLSD